MRRDDVRSENVRREDVRRENQKIASAVPLAQNAGIASNFITPKPGKQMKKEYFLMSLFFLTLSFVACHPADRPKTVTKYDPCVNGHDTTFYLSFIKDTTTKDFYQLLDFIEGKGEFSRFNKKHKIDSSTNNCILLQKILCEDKGFDTPIESWLLEDVFSIRYYMTSGQPVKGEPNYFPKFDITQFNFKTEAEKNKAYAKIKEIGWGDPLKKWNDYYIITSKQE